MPLTNEPWIGQRTGLVIMALISLALAVFTAWNLAPSQGLWSAVLWGFGFGLAIWLVFFLAFSFNKWVRGRRRS